MRFFICPLCNRTARNVGDGKCGACLEKENIEKAKQAELDVVNKKKEAKRRENERNKWLKDPYYYTWRDMRRRARKDGVGVAKHWDEDFFEFKRWLLINGFIPGKTRVRRNGHMKWRKFMPWSPETCVVERIKARWTTFIKEADDIVIGQIRNRKWFESNDTKKLACGDGRKWTKPDNPYVKRSFNKYKKQWKQENN